MKEYREFYHTQTVDGVLRLGDWDHRPVLDKYRAIPVAGRTVLDVGTRDGFFARTFAEGGAASVTGMDVVITPVLRSVAKECGFEIDHANVHGLIQQPPNRFQVVFCGDVIQHLENPLGAIRALAWAASETVYLVTDIHANIPERCVIHGEEHYPFLWGHEFVLGLMRLAGLLEPVLLDCHTVTGNRYAPRTVGIFRGIANPLYEIPITFRSPTAVVP